MNKSEVPNWSRQEFQTYLYIYCINADYKETKEELKKISLKINNEMYKKIHTEFEKDNDYTSIQKIKNSFNNFYYKQEEIDRLFNEIKELFLSDGKYDILEKNLMKGLKRLLS